MISDVLFGLVAILILAALTVAAAGLMPKRKEQAESAAASKHTQSKEVPDPKVTIAQTGEACQEAKVEQKKTSILRKGRLALKKNNYTAAESFLYQASGMGEEDPSILKELAQCLLVQNKKSKARVILEKLAQIEPTEDNLIQLGELLRDLGQQDGKRDFIENSIFCFQAILKHSPGDIQALQGLADTYKALGMEQEVIKIFEELFRLENSNIPIAIHLLDYYNAQGLTEQHRILLDQVWNLAPHDTDVLRRRMRYLFTMEDYAETLVVCEQLLEIESSAEALKIAGISAHRLQDYERVVLYFSQLVELQADDGKILYNLALACFNTDRFSKALGYLQQAIDLNADDAKYHFLQGRIHLASDDKDAARISFGRVIKLDPQHFEARQQLRRLS